MSVKVIFECDVCHKCALRQTRGPATDVRLRWPGCRAWEARP